jgi:TolB protein
MRRGILLVLVLALFAVSGTACGLFQSDDEAARSQLDEEPEVESGPGRIAYVGLDGHVRTVNPDGSGALRISPRTGIYSWPTWSPDGNNLVFSGLTEDESGRRRATLFDRDLSTGEVSRVHVGEPGDAFVAIGAPHYVYWSPDSSSLAFLSGTAGGLRLYVDDLRDDEGPRTAMDGVPVFMDWSPDSESLLIHFANDHFVFDVDQGDLDRLELPSEASGYKVPTWKPNTDLMTYVTAGRSGGLTLYTARVGADQMPLVERVPEDAAFRWSPDGRLLAVTSPDRVIPYPPLGLLVYQRISLYAEDGTRQATEIEDDVVAFFWSPDSTKLAYVTLVRQERDVLRWKVLNIANGAESTLIDFIPSADQLTMLQFFDQFAGSHQLWSPDSRSLVFAGRIGGGAILASTAQAQIDRIIVVAARSFPSTDVIASGTLAFWSPG